MHEITASSYRDGQLAGKGRGNAETAKICPAERHRHPSKCAITPPFFINSSWFMCLGFICKVLNDRTAMLREPLEATRGRFSANEQPAIHGEGKLNVC